MQHYQGCQLPDFSLRSQTFCYIGDFSTTFLYLLKNQDFFAYPITKPPASTLKLKKIRLYFAKTFCDPRQKLGKRPHSTGSSCAWAGLWPAVRRTLSISRSFQTFLKHNVGISEHYKIGLLLMHNVQQASLRAPTVLRGVVHFAIVLITKCQNSLHGGGIFKLRVAKWEIPQKRLRTTE